MHISLVLPDPRANFRASASRPQEDAISPTVPGFEGESALLDSTPYVGKEVYHRPKINPVNVKIRTSDRRMTRSRNYHLDNGWNVRGKERQNLNGPGK